MSHPHPLDRLLNDVLYAHLPPPPVCYLLRLAPYCAATFHEANTYTKHPDRTTCPDCLSLLSYDKELDS